tara:strand:+ start:598 stop:789 length:192 start_codon:yes stop_codon:yes gene_type:complete
MAVKDDVMINWINSWKSGNKREKYNIELRLGRFTLLEIKFCVCTIPCDCARFRMIVLNFGFEL